MNPRGKYTDEAPSRQGLLESGTVSPRRSPAEEPSPRGNSGRYGLRETLLAIFQSSPSLIMVNMSV